MICEKCGYGGTRIDNTPGVVTCLRDGCGHAKFIGGVVVDRPRLRRIALGRIPANQDCPHTNQCGSALRGECCRAAYQGEEYPCPVAREVAA